MTIHKNPQIQFNVIFDGLVKSRKIFCGTLYIVLKMQLDNNILWYDLWVLTFYETIIFGTIKLNSPYLWPGVMPSKPLTDVMNITHQGRSETVKRALSDFGIDDSFSTASRKFKEHYNFEIGISTAYRVVLNR